MTSLPNKPNDLCICGHDFTSHNSGPIEVLPGRFTHHIKEYKTSCKICNCEIFTKKKSIWEKFWNGPEPENWNPL